MNFNVIIAPLFLRLVNPQKYLIINYSRYPMAENRRVRRGIHRDLRNSGKSGRLFRWLAIKWRTFGVNCVIRPRRVVTHVTIDPASLAL